MVAMVKRENNKKKTEGRPPLDIDEKVVESLASINCTMIEIASAVGCSVDTLERRFADIIRKGREVGKSSLRRLQWKQAEGGNVSMLIWLGKQWLGQRERQEDESSNIVFNVTVEDVPRDKGKKLG